MRLLQRLDIGALCLTKDLNENDIIPPYAILSHTWVDGQEVTYQDLEANTGKGKSSYKGKGSYDKGLLRSSTLSNNY